MSDPAQPSATPPASPPACTHPARLDGVCTTCGHCLHEVVLNGACYYCGSTDLDPIALSPKPPDQIVQIVPASRLVRRKPPSGSGS